MNNGMDFEIRNYEFNSGLFEELKKLDNIKDLWPIIYILSNLGIRKAYVGETTDAHTRMNTHFKNESKRKLISTHLILSDKFNKSATLDIESKLIKYMDGDGQYKLLNGNLGLAHHNYYQKEELYQQLFKSIWDKLRAEGIAKHSIEHINNSYLFKYSPYKTLSNDQKKGLLNILDALLQADHSNIIIEGGAGTGKSILAVFLFKLLLSDNEDFNYKEFGEEESRFIRKAIELKNKFQDPKMALVVPMSSFRSTLKKVFNNINGLNSDMVIGPAEIANDKFDIVVVDEAHRLRRRVNLGNYFVSFDKACKKLGLDKKISNELDWILKQSKHTIFFYDQEQSIKPSDVLARDFGKLKEQKGTIVKKLKSQLRSIGGVDYVQYIDNLLKCNMSGIQSKFKSGNYSFLLFDSVDDLINEIKDRNEKHGLSRLTAGYSWEWVSKKNKDKFDIVIGDNHLKWNSCTQDWINTDNAINEVGCIHTTQAYDLNYTGVIFGNEISYNKAENKIEISKKDYYDRNGKSSIQSPEDLKIYIINIYKTLLLRSIRGTFVYACNKNLQEYFELHIPKFQKHSPEVETIDPIPSVNSVPLYDLKVAAGDFSLPQKQENTAWVALPVTFKQSQDLFACRVIGESMNKVIPNGSVCLFKKYIGGPRNGKIVLVEHTKIQDPDFGSGYTVKEYHSAKRIEGDSWKHKSITLKPLSHDTSYKDIILSEDESIQLRVIGIFECVLPQ